MLSNGFEVCFLLIVNLLETKLIMPKNYIEIIIIRINFQYFGFPKYFLVDMMVLLKRVFTMAVEKPGVDSNLIIQQRG